MKFRSTLLLTAILAVLCAAFFLMEYRTEKTAREAIAAKQLFSFAPESITELEIDRLDEAPVAARRAGAWIMTKPNPTIPPLQPLWDRVATHLAHLVNERTINEMPDDLRVYGLDEPLLAIRAAAADESFTIAFGKMEPTQTFRFARLNDGPVFLVNTAQFFELNRPLNDLRNRFLVNDREATIKRLEFARILTEIDAQNIPDPPPLGQESNVLILERENADGLWRITAPYQAPANQEAVNDLVKELQFGVARGFIDAPEDLRDYGLQPPRVRISLYDDKDSGAQTLYFGGLDHSGDKGGIFTKRADREAVFLCEGHLLTLFPVSLEAFREHRVLTRQAREIVRLDYRSGESAFRFERDPNQGWKIEAPGIDASDPLAISNFIGYLKAIRGAGFLKGAPAEFGLESPEIAVTLHFQDGGDPAEIRFAPLPSDPENYYAATQDTGAVLFVESESAHALRTTPARFRARTLLHFTKAHAVRLEFQFEHQGYIFEKVHGQWLVRAPENKTLSNQSDAATLLDAVATLNATAIDDLPEETTGLDRPIFTLYVTIQDPEDAAKEERLGPLTIGGAVEGVSGARYAASAVREGLFQVKQDLIETIRESLRGLRDK